MSHVLTLIADRAATTLSAALIARVREAVGGGPTDMLSPGEAADIPCGAPPDPAAIARHWTVPPSTPSRPRRAAGARAC